MKILLTFLITGFLLQAHGQCLSGNCVNGEGKFDFGWCVYTGQFKDGKPEGKGTMKYDDYSYTGNFRNGLEDGEGIITNKDGSKQNVQYNNGIKYTAAVVKLKEGEYKALHPQDVNCISGDCINGFGTYLFPSGNKYTGNFKEYKREGEGTFYFQNGDRFTGAWANNTESKGTYSYASGPQYTGTYDGNGRELNGQIVLGNRIIPFENGKAIIPPPPVINYAENGSGSAPARSESTKKICPMCRGSRRSHVTIPGGSYKLDRYGNKETIFGEYTNCILCNGTGYVN
ncbi:MAG: hypothetical protein ABI091_32130 [Ferruginibacter sp.]